VLFFKRILNFTQEAAAQREQRHAERYAVAVDSPLQARLEIGGRAHTGRLVNLSSTGVSIRLPAVLATDRGAAGRLELAMEQHTLSTPVKVAHHQPDAHHTVLGLQLLFGDFDTKKGYLQLLEPVAIGAGLRAGDPTLVRERERGLVTTLYHGPGDTLLTVWSSFAGQAIQGFEFRMHDYFVRSGATAPALEVFICEEQTDEHKLGYRVPALKRAGEENTEILRLFRWVLPNLNRRLPDDVREFLARFNPAAG
jgi:hypothetical protein